MLTTPEPTQVACSVEDKRVIKLLMYNKYNGAKTLLNSLVGLKKLICKTDATRSCACQHGHCHPCTVKCNKFIS